MAANYMYLHCDEYKSHASMNASHENIIYRKRAGRRAMWKEIKDDIKKDFISVSPENIPKIREYILNGNPEDANDYITYAFILQLEEAV